MSTPSSLDDQALTYSPFPHDLANDAHHDQDLGEQLHGCLAKDIMDVVGKGRLHDPEMLFYRLKRRTDGLIVIANGHGRLRIRISHGFGADDQRTSTISLIAQNITLAGANAYKTGQLR